MRPSHRLNRAALVLGICPILLVGTAAVAVSDTTDETYQNTWAKDFIMDAPWRVIDENTAIPITIILKDCDVDNLDELHWIRCSDVTGGGATTIWQHDFGDERIGNDVWEENYWTYISTVTEGHPSLPDGTLLTPANLGYGPGDRIELMVEVYFKDNWFNSSETRRLRVDVGGGPFPWPEDWYGGDTHAHSMYTNNIAEYGAPLPAVRRAAAAMGLHWLTVTDHSCDLDETGDGLFSYATLYWEYTLQSPSGIETFYRDNVAHGSSWSALGADVDDFSGFDFRIYRGVEINLASIDSDSYDKTLHALFYNPDYIESALSGAIGERPVRPTLPDGLDLLAAMNGFGFAAHPMSDMSTEWGGIDWTVNGAAWGDSDIDAALTRDAFRGLEGFNTRATRESNDENDPWSDFDNGQVPDDPYPNELMEGIAVWDALLRRDLSAPRFKIFFSGGSDAHGDFNYGSYLGLDNYATDNALGKVQTVAYVPGGYGPGNLPPTAEILDAFRAGRTVVTDGPFVEIGLDRDGDGDWYEEGDLRIGDAGTAYTDAMLPLVIRWASLPEFGAIVSVRLLAGDGSETVTLDEFDPSMAGEGYIGMTSLDLGGPGYIGRHYFRAEVETDDGDVGHRAYTNPIWIDFEEPSAVDGLFEKGFELGPAVPNPILGETEILFRLTRPGPVTVMICDLEGRRVRTLLESVERPAGWSTVEWDTTDDARRPLPAGIYFCRLTAGGESRVRKVALLGVSQ